MRVDLTCSCGATFAVSTDEHDLCAQPMRRCMYAVGGANKGEPFRLCGNTVTGEGSLCEYHDPTAEVNNNAENVDNLWITPPPTLTP